MRLTEVLSLYIAATAAATHVITSNLPRLIRVLFDKAVCLLIESVLRRFRPPVLQVAVAVVVGSGVVEAVGDLCNTGMVIGSLKRCVVSNSLFSISRRLAKRFCDLFNFGQNRIFTF